MGETAPGTKLSLDVLRDGKTEHFAVTTASKPGANGGDENSASAAGEDQGVLNGVGVGDIDSSARRDLNLPERINGAVITSVDPELRLRPRRPARGRRDHGDRPPSGRPPRSQPST